MAEAVGEVFRDEAFQGDGVAGWAVVQVMGHRVVAGWCEDVRVAGSEMLRVTPPGKAPEDPPGDPQILSAAAIFAMTPCTVERAREVTHPPEPSYRPQLTAFSDDTEDADGTFWGATTAGYGS